MRCHVEQKTFTTAVVLIPPSAAQPAIQSIRQVHDRHFKRWMPHITLLYPFRPHRQFDQLAERFAAACEAIKPFAVELAELQFFRHRLDSFTLWLAPEPKETLVRLQAVLGSVVPDCDDVVKHRDGFTPHLSVGQVRGDASRQALQQTLQSTWQPLSFMAREVSLIWRSQPPDDVFRVGHTVRLETEEL
jgi:RNA 2',3'-cyclic 3'-phosphodiesterase